MNASIRVIIAGRVTPCPCKRDVVVSVVRNVRLTEEGETKNPAGLLSVAVVFFAGRAWGPSPDIDIHSREYRQLFH